MGKIALGSELTWRELLSRVALVLISVIIIVWAMPRDSQATFKVEKDKPWRYADFTAPFNFTIYKSDATLKADRDKVMKQFKPCFNIDPNIESTMLRKFTEEFAEGIPGLPGDYVSIIANRLHALYEKGIMTPADYERLSADTSRMVRLMSGKEAASVHIKSLLSTKTAYEKLYEDPVIASKRILLQRCNLNNYIQANLIYDKELSDKSLKTLLDSIPKAIGQAQRGEKIVDRGQIVDENTLLTIESYMKESERIHADRSQVTSKLLGETLYVWIIIMAFTLYLSLFRKDYFEHWRSIAMLYSLIIIFSVIALQMVSHAVLHVFFLPFAFVPIIVRVFMDSRTAFMTHTVMVLLVASVLQHPFDFIAIEEMGGLAAIYSLRELSSRSQLFRTAILVCISMLLTNLALDWILGDDITMIDYSEYNYILISGALLFCSYPLLYFIEKLFGFTSNITLIELSDMNKDLLRRMSEVAPGTFNHSIQVGNLAAEIANKIGAKAQLVRTGALYHDIGKIQNPIYFTENQSGVSPHEHMSYVDSAQVIISHVTEGLKLAEKYNLPDIIKEFISTHHGQGKAKYFYVKYRNEHPDESIDELLFTYPGPNPFTREQAILMMADSVEAASRSLPDYTEQTIRDLVNRILDTQVSEGYFRECPITFRDIQYAKTVLIEKLKIIYHTRISYPELNKQ